MNTFTLTELTGNEELETLEYLDLLELASVINKHAMMAALYGADPEQLVEATIETTERQALERGYSRIEWSN